MSISQQELLRNALYNTSSRFAALWSSTLNDLPEAINMPSLRDFVKAATGAGLLASSAVATPKSCPVTSSTPLSCQNTTAVADLCCFNAPGGQLLQTQFWDTDPATGPTDSWTIHGLWPDHCKSLVSKYIRNLH